MARVYLEYRNRKWHEVSTSNFWIDRALLGKLKNLKKIQAKGWDGVVIIDGKERSGKSVLGMVIGWYLSNTKMTINNFARGLGDAAKEINDLPDKSVLIMDEGSTIFSSKDAMAKAQKKLIKIMDVVGQKNLIFIVCLPCFFDLNKTIAVRRSLFLCHIYPDENYNRGKYAYWGEKNKKALYKFGKQNMDSYKFPNAEFVGSYQDFEPPFYKEYKEIVKKESLKEVIQDAMEGEGEGGPTIAQIEGKYLYNLKENYNFSIKDLKDVSGRGERTIYQRIKDYKESMEGGVCSAAV